MEKSEAIQLVKGLIEEADTIRQDGSLFGAWQHKCGSVLGRIFGDNSKQAQSLTSVDYCYHGLSVMGDIRYGYSDVAVSAPDDATEGAVKNALERLFARPSGQNVVVVALQTSSPGSPHVQCQWEGSPDAPVLNAGKTRQWWGL